MKTSLILSLFDFVQCFMKKKAEVLIKKISLLAVSERTPQSTPNVLKI
jgi:hypothetical protein